MTRTAVITFGRMNPITAGHEKLINKLSKLSRVCEAEPLLFLSHTSDNTKNPLDYLTKILLAKQAFPDVNVRISNSRTIIEVMRELQGDYTDVIKIVGSDRVIEFDNLLQKYNNKDYYFDSITVASAGTRDPDSSDVDGMSATKMREAAKNADEQAFTLGLPEKLKPMSKLIMNQVRKQIV